MRSSVKLLDSMGEVVALTGRPVAGAGWHGPTTGVHTVSIRALNFQGRVSVQAALAISPDESDWFSVLPGGVAYWQYPRPGYVIPPTNTGETSTLGFNFCCNAIWVRAAVTRSYFMFDATPSQLQYAGVIDSILLNY